MFARLWSRIQQVLDAREPRWQQRIENMGQIASIEAREAGRRWTDSEVFEGIVRAVLSAQTDWAKVERVIPELTTLFEGFDLQHYSSHSPNEIERTFVPWFVRRRAGSMSLRRDLINLVGTARQLLAYSSQYGSVEDFVTWLLRRSESDPKRLVMRLGSYGSEYKLPAMGVPIAAEAMKNLGFDVAKPDRHVCRAMGSFGMNHFPNWNDRTGTKGPVPSESGYLQVMGTMEIFAKTIAVRPAFLDNAVWLLCAQSGAHLTNDRLAELVL